MVAPAGLSSDPASRDRDLAVLGHLDFSGLHRTPEMDLVQGEENISAGVSSLLPESPWRKALIYLSTRKTTSASVASPRLLFLPRQAKCPGGPGWCICLYYEGSASGQVTPSQQAPRHLSGSCSPRHTRFHHCSWLQYVQGRVSSPDCWRQLPTAPFLHKGPEERRFFPTHTMWL